MNCTLKLEKSKNKIQNKFYNKVINLDESEPSSNDDYNSELEIS